MTSLENLASQWKGAGDVEDKGKEKKKSAEAPADPGELRKWRTSAPMDRVKEFRDEYEGAHFYKEKMEREERLAVKR